MLSKLKNFVLYNSLVGYLFVVLRVYLGWLWVHAGYEKVTNTAWVGDNAGAAMTGFVKGALAKTGGEHPDVSMWYAWFLENAVVPYIEIWSYLITFGEIFVGLGLIFGLFTYLASFFGAFMNYNFLFAGTVSANPIMLLMAILLMVANTQATTLSLDRSWRKKF
ncbi:MAG: DoxX family membrane protein [Patescibacteria group bacterium]